MFNQETLTQLVQTILAAQAQAPPQRVDPRGAGEIDVKTLRHPGEFSGKEQDWQTWCFKWEAYCALLGMEEEMNVA
eukprot:287337-Amphidinium_carterae.1